MFEYGGLCLTPDQCEDNNGRAYYQAKMCIEINATGDGFDEGYKNNKIYYCKGAYLDVTGAEAKCISEEECRELTRPSRNLCITKDQCGKYPYYGVMRTKDDKTQCIYPT